MIQAVGGRERVMLPHNRAEGGIGKGLKWRMVEQPGIRSLYRALKRHARYPKRGVAKPRGTDRRTKII
jgi:hypothetical protein